MGTPSTPDLTQWNRERQFVEEFGLLISSYGAAPMFGRIMGHLLVCDPPEQSSAEIAEALDASKGSVSTTTRQLIAAGMIQKVPRPGSRATYFRIVESAWADMMRVEMARMRVIREMAERGLAVLSDAPPERKERLEHLRAFFRFMETEWPQLMDHWASQPHEEEP